MKPRSDRLGLYVFAFAFTLHCAFGSPAASETREPTRVATLLPFVEDALLRVPGDFRVVATVRRSLHSPPRTTLADLGSAHAPSLENLAMARPDLIIGDRAIHQMLAADLEGRDFGSGEPELLLIDTSTVDATLESLRSISRKLGNEQGMASAIDSTQMEIARFALSRPVPTLAVFGTPGRFMVMSERTWLGDLLADLRFDNVAPASAGDERFPGLIDIDDEVLATMHPELVLLVAHGDPTAVRADLERRIARGGAWAGVRDSAKRGVHVLPARTFAANPGLALDGAAKTLAELASEPAAAGPASRR